MKNEKGILEFLALLEEMKTIHIKKNQDYAAQDKPFENFQRSAELIQWFTRAEDIAFVALIATKLARLATLLNGDSEPKNESIEDTFLDLTTYCGLWAAYHRRFSSSSFPVRIPFLYQCKQCGIQEVGHPLKYEDGPNIFYFHHGNCLELFLNEKNKL